MILTDEECNGDLKEPDVEDAIAEALKGVTAEDWDSLPADLTDRLDQYLYGAESD